MALEQDIINTIVANQHVIRDILGVGGGGSVVCEDDGAYYVFVSNGKRMFKVQKSNGQLIIEGSVSAGKTI